MGTYSLNIQFHLKNEKEKTSAYTGFSLALALQKEVLPLRASNTNKRKSRTPTRSRASLPHLVAISAQAYKNIFFHDSDFSQAPTITLCFEQAPSCFLGFLLSCLMSESPHLW